MSAKRNSQMGKCWFDSIWLIGFRGIMHRVKIWVLCGRWINRLKFSFTPGRQSWGNLRIFPRPPNLWPGHSSKNRDKRFKMAGQVGSVLPNPREPENWIFSFYEKIEHLFNLLLCHITHFHKMHDFEFRNLTDLLKGYEVETWKIVESNCFLFDIVFLELFEL